MIYNGLYNQYFFDQVIKRLHFPENYLLRTSQKTVIIISTSLASAVYKSWMSVAPSNNISRDPPF